MTTFARWLTLGAIFLIPFVVLVAPPFTSGLFFPFITGKAFAFRVLVELAFAGWVLLALADKRYRPKFSWTLGLYGLLVLWMIIADAFAVNPMKAFWSNYERMDGFVTLIHVFVFFVVTGSVLSVGKLWRKWWLTFLSASALIALYGLGQILCKGATCGLPGAVFEIHQGGVRVDASLGNAAYLASYLLFSTAVALWQAFVSRGGLRVMLFALAGLHLIILFFTATRGAILAAVGAAGIGGLLWLVLSGTAGKKIAAGFVVFLIVLSGGFLLVKNTSFVQNDGTLSRIASISMEDLATRMTIWNMALQGAVERPVTGWGQEGFNYVFQKYYAPSMYAQEPWFDRAHNTFLDWLIAGGVPAFLLFIALLVAAVRAIIRSDLPKSERVLLIAALAAYSIQALVVFDHMFSYIPLAAILAMAHGLTMRPIAAIEKPQELSTTALQTSALPVVGVLAVAAIWFVNVPAWSASQNLIQGLSPQGGADKNLEYFKKAVDSGSFATQEIREQIISFTGQVVRAEQVPEEQKYAFAQYALEQMNEEVTRVPNDARLRAQFASGLQAVGAPADALTQIDAAIALSPKKQTLLIQKGLLLWSTGDVVGAEATFRAAYELDTSFADPAAYLAAVHIAGGDIAGGKALLMEKYGTTTVDNSSLILAYYQAQQWNELIAIWQMRVATNDTADNWFKLAAAYVAAGQYTQARAAVETGVARHPDAATQGATLLNQLRAVGQ